MKDIDIIRVILILCGLTILAVLWCGYEVLAGLQVIG